MKFKAGHVQVQPGSGKVVLGIQVENSGDDGSMGYFELSIKQAEDLARLLSDTAKIARKPEASGA